MTCESELLAFPFFGKAEKRYSTNLQPKLIVKLRKTELKLRKISRYSLDEDDYFLDPFYPDESCEENTFNKELAKGSIDEVYDPTALLSDDADNHSDAEDGYESIERKHLCTACGERFKMKIQLYRHKKEHHSVCNGNKNSGFHI